MASMAPAKPSFVFMHYSNPAEDSKLLENRQKVAKYAMLGRQKKPTQTQNTKCQAQPRPKTERQTQRPRAPSPRDTSPASTSSNWDAVPIQDSHKVSYAESLPSLSDDISSAGSVYSSSPSFASPDIWPVTLQSTESQYVGRPILTRHDSKFDPSLQGQDIVPSFVSANEYHGLTSPELVDYTKPRGYPRQDPTHSQVEDTRLAERRRQGKKRHEQAKIKREDSQKTVTDDESSALAVVPFRFADEEGRYNPRHQSPRTILSASGSQTDPFSCLPIKANAHTHELLYQYMNARLISNLVTQGSPESFNRIKLMRKTVWGPLTMKSKAALNALVAYVESTPGLPIKSRSKDFLFSHVGAALEAIGEALKKPDVATDDSICLAVVLLMLTAQREGSTATYARHAAGLATLLSFRTQALHKHGEQQDTVSKLRSFYTTNPDDECNYCRTNGSPSRHTTPQPFQEAFVIDPQTFSDECAPRGEGFRHLIRQGVLTEAMSTFVEPAMIWSTLAERARRDKLSAAIGATHAWIDQGEDSLAGMVHPPDTAVFHSVRLCFYLSSWLDWQHNCFAVRRMADAVHAALMRSNVDLLLIQSPELIVWLCLMAGPLCDEVNRLYFLALLDRAKSALNLTQLDFHSQIENFSYMFVWSATMTNMAQFFWDESYYNSPGALDPVASFEPNNFDHSFADSYQTGTVTELWEPEGF